MAQAKQASIPLDQRFLDAISEELVNKNSSDDLLSLFQSRSWCVAFSGGLDSRVLLDLLVKVFASLQVDKDESLAVSVKVIHVHHGLSDQADQWWKFCEETCKAYRYPIEFIARKVSLEKKGSIEEQARTLRYQVFESVMNENDVLLMGHHLNDQAETFFQRVLRGSGLVGLKGIPASRRLGQGTLLRPLLQESRSTLKAYAKEEKLVWIEDESNASTVFDRNYLRHEVIPLLERRWPGVLRAVQRVTSIVTQEAMSLQFYREQWLLDHADAFYDSKGSKCISIKALKLLPEGEQIGLLSYWTRKISGNTLTHQQLTVLLAGVVDAKEDAQACLEIGEYQYRRYQGFLFCLLEVAVRSEAHWHKEVHLKEGQASIVDLPSGDQLIIQPEKGGLYLPTDHVCICFRQGGESFKPVGDAHTRSLKKWLQEQKVPPWQRSLIPLLYCNDELVAIADLSYDKKFHGETNQDGWRVIWRR